MENVFDPIEHRVVAVTKTGQHIHVSLHELKADMYALPPAPVVMPQVVIPATVSDDWKLPLAAAVANAAITNGVQAGDLRWHGGDSDFEWQGVKMDAPTLLEHAKRQL